MTDPDDGPYCHECGNDEPRKLAAIHTPANGTVFRCQVCGHEFIHSRRRD